MRTLMIKDLCYTYNEQMILSKLNLNANKGEFVIILGRSGSGKSTLLYLISGCLKKQKGNIGYDKKEEIGILFQSPTLLNDFTVIENIALPLITKGMKKNTALTKAEEIMKQIGIEELHDRKIDELSGGQQARVQIARTLITSPSILLLDEPTGSLDQENTEELIKLFKELSKTRLVIMVTHREQIAYAYGTTVYRLSNGQLKLKKKEKINSVTNKEESYKEKRINLKTKLEVGYSFIKHKPLRIFFSLLFLSFSVALLSVMSSLLLDINSIFLSTAKTIYNYNLVSVSYINEIEIGEETTLIQKSAPTTIPVDYINSYLPFSEVLGSSVRIFNNDNTEFVTSRFEPSIGESDIIPIYGHDISSSFEVLANINLAKELNVNIEDLIGKKIELNRNVIIETNIRNQKILDSLSINESLTIVGIINETQGLNSAAIYYSYENFYRELSKTYLNNVSLNLERTYSVIDRLNNASGDDSLLGYSMLFEVDDPNFIKTLLKDDYEVTSFALTYIESNASLIESIVTVLDFFLILILIGAFLLELFTMNTIYEEQKKTLALFKTFNLSNRNYYSLFFSMAEILAFITIFLSFLFELFLNSFLNLALLKMDLPKMFNFTFVSIPNIIMVCLILVLAYFASQYSLTRLNKQKIVLSLAEDIC